MNLLLLHHLETVRSITLKVLSSVTEQESLVTPDGFSNNIVWNLGHIAYIQEKLVFELAGKKNQLPASYERLFAAGTIPSQWKETPPTLIQLKEELMTQTERIKEFIPAHYDLKLAKPFTNKAGISFDHVGSTFLFSFYHEGMHVETIKQIKKAIQEKKS
ncbi:DinB family protein [Priestia flexa]|jgi:DinB superfamily|uniref:DinB family protein n=1 Tax=Priestia flexa TaxID=86664 RepID=UPI000E67D9E2|nr:DinB family protein [Priestia flexa]MBN8435444.1 DinB family protein [Priestia flexa]MCA0967980.1 DinB family protein [Priestia flexa]RIV12364.1 DinB family protein [Priestia flexa]UIR28597.1 DinB family protein [Priestia flexa]UZW64983.1 DinB family protein [Priestia flexa]